MTLSKECPFYKFGILFAIIQVILNAYILYTVQFGMLVSKADAVHESVTVMVNSRNRVGYPNTSPATMSYILPEAIERVSKITVLSVQIPYSFYSVNAFTGYQFYYKVSGTSHSVSFEHGNYNLANICDTLKTLLDTAGFGAPFTVTYSPITLKVTISSGSNIQVLASAGGDTHPMSARLGFTADSAVGTSVTGDAPVDLSGPPVILITSATLNKYQTTVPTYGSITNIIHTVPVNVGPSGVIVDIPQHPAPIIFNNRQTITGFDLYLLDETGREMLLNGHEWCIQFLFEIS